MSEEEVRDTLRVLYEEFYVKEVGFDDHTASAVYGALDANPDVVTVLRMLLRLRDSMTPSGHNLPFRAAMEMVYERIVNEFHVRLTDDGWEWTKMEM